MDENGYIDHKVDFTENLSDSGSNSWNDEISEDYDDELDNLEDLYNEDAKEKEDQPEDIISESEDGSVYDINGEKIVVDQLVETHQTKPDLPISENDIVNNTTL